MNKTQCKEKILSKVNKILAKTQNNPSAKECETAFLLAQELLIKNGLTMQDAESTRTKKRDIVECALEINNRNRWWRGGLSTIIAENFKCKNYIQHIIKDNKKIKVIKFMGFAEDVEIAISVYNHIIDNIEYMSNMLYHKMRIKAKNQFPKRAFTPYKNSYIHGYLGGLDKKYREQIEQNEWGLVVLVDKTIEDKFDGMNLKTKRSKIKKDNTGEAFKKGFTDGYKSNYSKKESLKL